MSQSYAGKNLKHLRKLKGITQEEFAPVKLLFFCESGLLKTVFNYVDNEYGGVTNYFQSELGLNATELELLK